MAAVPAGAEERMSYFWSVAVEAGQTQQGDVLCFFCNVRVRGTAVDDIIVIGGSAEIEGTAKQDVIVIGGGIRLGPQARAEQDLIAIGGPVAHAEGAVINAPVISKPYFHLPGQRELFWWGMLTCAALDLFVAVFGYLLIRKRRTENLAATLRARPGVVFLAGLAAVALAIALLNYADVFGRFEEEAEIVGVLIVATIGSPGYVGLCRFLGSEIRRDSSPWMAVALGSVLVTIFLLIPVVGAFLMLAAAVLACGATVVSRFGARSPVTALAAG